MVKVGFAPVHVSDATVSMEPVVVGMTEVLFLMGSLDVYLGEGNGGVFSEARAESVATIEELNDGTSGITDVANVVCSPGKLHA